MVLQLLTAGLHWLGRILHLSSPIPRGVRRVLLGVLGLPILSGWGSLVLGGAYPCL